MVRKVNNRISLIVQAGKLKKLFPDSYIHRIKEDSLIWIHNITPTPLSNSYKVKIIYRRNKRVECYVLEPQLPLAEGKKHLPHVYSTAKQKLCLFYPNTFEWNVGMLLTETMVPWASEWLFHYEIWLATGEWKGGGTKHDEYGDVAESLKVEVARRSKRMEGRNKNGIAK